MSWLVTPQQKRIPIPISNLVFAVDAGATDSYIGSGTTWTDIGGSNNATLTNGAVFNSANSGSISFDGADDYAITSTTALDLSSSITISAFVSPGFASSSSAGRAIFDFSNSGGTRRNYLRWEGPSLGFYWDCIGSGANSPLSRTTTAPVFNSGSWLHVCVTITANSGGQYFINGSSVATTNAGTFSTTGVTNFPVKIGLGQVNSYYWNGKIAAVHLFNKALTSNEVRILFDLYRGRYGL